MKILVIGGAGYLGLKLSKRLLLDRFHVTICDNMNYDTYDVIDKLSDKFNWLESSMTIGLLFDLSSN